MSALDLERENERLKAQLAEVLRRSSIMDVALRDAENTMRQERSILTSDRLGHGQDSIEPDRLPSIEAHLESDSHPTESVDNTSSSRGRKVESRERAEGEDLLSEFSGMRL